MRSFTTLLITILWVAGVTGQSHQSYALFFAVDQYEELPDLNNPVKNARDIAAELEKSYGFKVEVVANPTLNVMEDKIREYQNKFGQGIYDQQGQLLLFFTGHGTTSGPNGYFMPADASEERAYRTGFEYDYWRNQIDQIACKHILVTVDACYSVSFDPSWPSKTDRQFGRPGSREKDQVLLDHATYRTRKYFTSDAKNDQTPDKSNLAYLFLEGLRTHQSRTGYLTADELFANYLRKAAPTPGGGAFGSNEPAARFLFFKRYLKKPGDTQADLADWNKAELENTTIAYEAYLKDHPQGDFLLIARKKIKELREQERMLADWEQAEVINTDQGYLDFIGKYPDSKYVDVAEVRRADLAAWQIAQSSNSVEAYQAYLTGSPDGAYIDFAQERIRIMDRKKIEQSDWINAQRSDTYDSYTSFLNKYPESTFKAKAKLLIKEWELWEEAQRLQSCETYRDYLGQYPKGRFVKLARKQIKSCDSKDQELIAWQKAEQLDTYDGYTEFIEKYPSSINVEEADYRRSDIYAWQLAEKTNECTAYRDYARDFPQGYFIETAKKIIQECEWIEQEEADWAFARSVNSYGAYTKFIEQYPESPYREKAIELRTGLGKSLISLGNTRNKDIQPDHQLTLIPSGYFMMGDNFGDGDRDELPVREVFVHGFYLSSAEVTNKEFVRFLNAEGNKKVGRKLFYDTRYQSSGISEENGSFYVKPELEQHPVAGVSWYGAIYYCNWLSTEEDRELAYNIDGVNIEVNWNANGYRLPTEAEWEFAARDKGSKQKFAGTSSNSELEKFANFRGGSKVYSKTAPVRTLKSNELGLFDMSGNVQEWCWDWYSKDCYANSPNRNPIGRNFGTKRVIRGGAWMNFKASCRTSSRSKRAPDDYYPDVGFRLAMSNL